MDLAELRLDLVGRGGHGFAVDHVDLDGVDAVLAGLECIERRADLVVADVADDHLHAGFVEHMRLAEADAAGAAGDEGHLAGDVAQGRGSGDKVGSARRGGGRLCCSRAAVPVPLPWRFARQGR